MILAGANTYRGDTTILEGTLQLNDGGSVTGNITNNATLAFNNSSTMTRPNAISGSGGISQTGSGTTILAGDYTATGPVGLAVGNITFPYTNAPRETAGVVLKASNLFIAPTSTLDITNHDLIIGNSNLTTVNNEILNGFGIGTGGAAITSSTALTNGTTFLVPLDATAFGITSWDNVPIDQPNSIIVKYTYFGDLNLDGVVDSSDYALLDQFLGTGNSWVTGDANLDGVVDSSDYALLDQFVGSGVSFGTPLFATGGDSPSAVVPEPASLFLLGLGSACVLVKRKRLTM